MDPKKTFQECQPKSTKDLVIDILEEYKILFNLLHSSGFTGVEDNYKIRQMLNKIIFEIRRIQDFMIKTNTKSKISNAITKKLKGSKKSDDCYEVTSRSKVDDRSFAMSRLKDDDDCCEATSRPRVDEENDGEINDI
jgi:hypothetical protein